MNKKGILNLLSIIIIFGFIVMSFVFVSNFMFQIGNDYLINQSVNAFNSTANGLNISDDSKAIINNIKTDYANTEINYDLFVVVMMLIALSSSVYTAIRTNYDGITSFFGVITFGFVLFLLMLSIFNYYTSWFYDQFIFNFLQFDISTQAPITYNYINNFSLYSFIWATLLLLLARLDFNFITNKGRFEQ